MLSGDIEASAAKNSAPAAPLTVRNCSMAAGRYTSVETVSTFFLRSVISRRASSLCTTPTSACPGVRLPSTSCPRARSRTRAMKSRTTGSATSASSSARRTSRSMSWVFASVRRVWPRICLAMRASRSVSCSSIGSGPIAAWYKETRYDRPRILRSCRILDRAAVLGDRCPQLGPAQDRVQVRSPLQAGGGADGSGPARPRDHAGLLDVRSGRSALRIRARAVRDDADQRRVAVDRGLLRPAARPLPAGGADFGPDRDPAAVLSRDLARGRRLVGGAAASSERGHPFLQHPDGGGAACAVDGIGRSLPASAVGQPQPGADTPVCATAVAAGARVAAVPADRGRLRAAQRDARLRGGFFGGAVRPSLAL